MAPVQDPCRNYPPDPGETVGWSSGLAPAPMPNALLVEDDRAALHALTALVENLGFSTFTASTWSEARTELLRHRLDVVLLDVFLPGGSGIDLLLEIPKERRPQVVLMSGDEAVRMAFASVPMQELSFVQKPIERAALTRALSACRRRLRDRKSTRLNSSH